MRTMIAVLDKSDRNAAKKVVNALAEMFPESDARFILATSSIVIEGKTAEALNSQKLESPIAIGSASQTVRAGKPLFLNLENATLAFGGKTYFPQPKPSLAEMVLAKIKQQSTHEKSAASFLRSVEGDFTLLVAEPERIIGARDPMGVQPLYFGENQAFAALASNRKALWKLGIEQAKSLPPGHLAIISKSEVRFRPVKTLKYEEPKPISIHDASDTLLKLLKRSMRLRVFGHKEVAVAFSGGLDSSVVACLAKQTDANIQLVHVSLEEHPETEEAKKAADALGLPLQVHLFTESDVEKVAPKVVELIEDADPIKAAVGVPFFWTAQNAAAGGFRVLLAGQGADELFGGYQRYVVECLTKSDKVVRQTMFHDVVTIHQSNIERDKKICDYHDVNLLLPFASYQIAKFAMSLPTELKFEKKRDSLRKLVLRKTAEKLGIPKYVAEKPKKAMQYSTGINSALKRLAKKKGMTLTEYVNQLFQQTRNKAGQP